MWKVKYVSEKAKKQFGIVDVIHEDKIGENIIIDRMTRPTVILNSKINVKLYGNNNTSDIINSSIYFTGVNIYSAINGELELSDIKIRHEEIFKSYNNITNIKITYMSTEEYRHCFRYEFKLENNDIVIKDVEVSCYEDLKFVIEDIYIRYTNGQQENSNATKYRSFEKGTQKWLKFLRENVESAYDVIFNFDTYNRELYCYATEEVGKNIGIKLTYQNYLEEMQIQPDYDNVVSKLWVSSEKCKISDVNPIGTEYIYDFSYFENNGLLTDECCEALKRYRQVVSSSENNLTE